MKKILLLGLLMVIQSVSAQIISYDSSFALNGKYLIPTASSSSNTQIIQNTDGSIYFTYLKDNISGNPETALSKLTPSGIVDLSFGNNGETIIPYNSYDTQLKKHTDGKLFIVCLYDDGTAVAKILPNGQLDPSFGTNGISTIPYIGSDSNTLGYGLYLQNNKPIVYGAAFNNFGSLLGYSLVYRLNENGTIDNTFGNNGAIQTAGANVFLDNQSNIISLISGQSNPTGAIEKYNSNGQPFTSFGNNGVLAFPSSPGLINAAFMDSSNNIICSNIDNEIFRINSNGVYDSSFIFDINAFPFTSTEGANLSLPITEKNGNYYISGITGSMMEKFFISKLTSTGNIDPVFNYYSETTNGLFFIGDMIINDTNIFAVRGNSIMKFLLNNSLATANTAKDTSAFSFENPVKKNLVYSSKEKVLKIEIYSVDGRLIKTIKESNSTVSDLSKGVYVAKISFENGKIISRKLIKD
ncbi:T9SS type A sorting domain-containing protein [Chryseobacterium lathyri]|jgi:uncharacterized delta-60 repeat protein|uniref:Secretion system C-terminal sorting domain-containing protein n=1 Tax=Chryseobacterium lathyri TaxID=395933 RepID=A0A511Y5N7_9FLAO|nr:T9SS type A sorting domain-containing protein [Chryseobacterium lathyri]GEN70498.1 hypothetical protein CLA01_05700 [Chryseobacterium lathyri]